MGFKSVYRHRAQLSLVPPTLLIKLLFQQAELQMVYEWDDKLDDAYRLYVVERMSLDHVIDWFKREKNFTPR